MNMIKVCHIYKLYIIITRFLFLSLCPFALIDLFLNTTLIIIFPFILYYLFQYIRGEELKSYFQFFYFLLTNIFTQFYIKNQIQNNKKLKNSTKSKDKTFSVVPKIINHIESLKQKNKEEFTITDPGNDSCNDSSTKLQASQLNECSNNYKKWQIMKVLSDKTGTTDDFSNTGQLDPLSKLSVDISEVSKGNTEWVFLTVKTKNKYLVSKIKDIPNSKDKEGIKQIENNVKDGLSDVILNSTKTNNITITPLDIACINGYTEIVKLLLDVPGIDTKKKDPIGPAVNNENLHNCNQELNCENIGCTKNKKKEKNNIEKDSDEKKEKDFQTGSKKFNHNAEQEKVGVGNPGNPDDPDNRGSRTEEGLIDGKNPGNPDDPDNRGSRIEEGLIDGENPFDIYQNDFPNLSETTNFYQGNSSTELPDWHQTPSIQDEVNQQISLGTESWSTIIESFAQKGMAWDVADFDSMNPPSGTPFYLFPFHGRRNQHFVYKNGKIYTMQNGKVITYAGGESHFQMMPTIPTLKGRQSFKTQLL